MFIIVPNAKDYFVLLRDTEIRPSSFSYTAIKEGTKWNFLSLLFSFLLFVGFFRAVVECTIEFSRGLHAATRISKKAAAMLKRDRRTL